PLDHRLARRAAGHPGAAGGGCAGDRADGAARQAGQARLPAGRAAADAAGVGADADAVVAVVAWRDAAPGLVAREPVAAPPDPGRVHRAVGARAARAARGAVGDPLARAVRPRAARPGIDVGDARAGALRPRSGAGLAHRWRRATGDPVGVALCA